MNAFGIYVHWPFCEAKCPYCDFNSHVRNHRDEAGWAEAVASELRAIVALQGAGRPSVSSIFFGGGTPSLIGGAAIARVLDVIAGLWTVAQDVEITLEANPNSAEQKRFRDYRAAGVNRLSVGVQALDDAALQALGRLHGADEARAAVHLAQELFPRVSLDLIYTRPGQSLAAWEAELDDALAFGTEHLSLYQLTIEHGTAFATQARQGALVLPDEDEAARFYEQTQAQCAAAGLPAYEISNHARPGAESRHNLLYWRYGDYAGVGPGAHGRLTLPGRRVATHAERLPERWRERIAENDSLALFDIRAPEAAREHLLMAMRLTEGIDLAAYAARWGRPVAPERIAALADEGLVTVTDGRLRATAAGRLVLNAVIAELAP